MAEFPKAFAAGWPAVNSLLPQIYRYWLQAYNLKGSYDAMPVDANALPRFLADIRQHGFCGGTISQPHKEAAFALVEKPSACARRLRAVNYVWLENDVLCGANSDAQGFSANLNAVMRGGAARAVVLGAGYAARVVLYALAQRGFGAVFLAARAESRAAELAALFGRRGKMRVETGGAAEVNAHLPQAGLVVNTGALGAPAPAVSPMLSPQADSAVLSEAAGQAAATGFEFMDFRLLPAGAAAADIVYSPQQTPFLRAAAAAGLKTVNGLGMLLYQAAPGFARWFGQSPQVDSALRRYIAAKIPA